MGIENNRAGIGVFHLYQPQQYPAPVAGVYNT